MAQYENVEILTQYKQKCFMAYIQHVHLEYDDGWLCEVIALW